MSTPTRPRRCGQGRDDQARHVRRESAGRRGHSFKAPAARSSTTTTCGASERCPSAGQSGSSTAPTTRRCSSSACTRRSWTRSGFPTIAGTRHLEATLRRDQRLGALPRRQRHPVVKLFLHVSKEEQRERFLERIEKPEKNWKFSARDVEERERWDDYKRAFSRCSRTPAPSGRPGTSYPPPTSGSPASPRRR